MKSFNRITTSLMAAGLALALPAQAENSSLIQAKPEFNAGSTPTWSKLSSAKAKTFGTNNVSGLPAGYSYKCDWRDVPTGYVIVKDKPDSSRCGSNTYIYTLPQNVPTQDNGLKYVCKYTPVSMLGGIYPIPSGYIEAAEVINMGIMCSNSSARGRAIILNSHPQIDDFTWTIPKNAVLQNELIYASDPDGDALEYETNQSPLPSGATTNFISNNVGVYFSYTPPLNAYGTDSFQIVARDGKYGIGVGNVTIVVLDQENQNPVPRFTGPITMGQEGSYGFGNITDDPDGLDTRITYNITVDKGSVAKSTFDQTHGWSYVYTAPVGEWGQARMTIAATDMYGGVSTYEVVFDILPTDADSDGLPDTWETQVGLNPTDPADAAADSDNDGLNNLGEFANATQPFNSDSDGDGMPDGFEVTYNSVLDPNTADDSADPDGDNYTNLQEYQEGTDPSDEYSRPINIAAVLIAILAN